MPDIYSIERDIEQLDEESFAALRAWFVEYDQARWDRQILSDSMSGKLDALIDQALSEDQHGRSRPM